MGVGMVPSASTTATIIATALLVVAPAHAVQVAGIADFLTTIGGDTDMKTAGSSPSDPSPQIYPLMHDASEVIGYRFFSQKITPNGSATAERTTAAFAQECVAKAAVSKLTTATSRSISKNAYYAAKYHDAFTSISGQGCPQSVRAVRPR